MRIHIIRNSRDSRDLGSCNFLVPSRLSWTRSCMYYLHLMKEYSLHTPRFKVWWTSQFTNCMQFMMDSSCHVVIDGPWSNGQSLLKTYSNQNMFLKEMTSPKKSMALFWSSKNIYCDKILPVALNSIPIHIKYHWICWTICPKWQGSFHGSLDLLQSFCLFCASLKTGSFLDHSIKESEYYA